MPSTAEKWLSGAAYIDGRFMPIGEATIPITDWGYRRSDVTYDVVSLWDGAFFKLDEHIQRFRSSMNYLRMKPRETDSEIRAVLHEVVRRSGLREAYIAMDCVRGLPPPRQARHPSNARNYLLAFAIPYVWLMPKEVVKRGVHLIVASARRIPEASVNPRAKNFHWGDFTQAQFEAKDKSADNAVLLSLDDHVTEGPGFNVFIVTDGVVATPDHGVLEGITRLAAMQICAKLDIHCELRTISLQELQNADEIFVTSTAGGVMPATRLDHRILGNGGIGPVTKRIHEAYWKFRSEGWCCEPVNFALPWSSE